MPLLIGTHSGGFHADDVLGVALIREFFGREASVLRSRDLDALSRCDVLADAGAEFDPAGRRVDHHHAKDEGPLPAAGMVLDWLQSDEDGPARRAKQLRHELVDYVDAVDNGRRSPDGDAPRFTSMAGAFTNDAGSDRAVGVPVEAAAAMPGGG